MSAQHRAGRRRTRRRVASLLTALLLPLAAITALAAPAHAAGKLTAAFTSADNGSWWKGTYIVHNDNATAVSGWTLEFDLPAGVTISGSYNGDATVSGRHVTAKNAYYNANVAAHGTTEPYSFWFVAGGPIGTPTGCRINGDKCDGSSDVLPGAPGTPQVTESTAHSLALSWPAATAGDFPVASYEVLSGATVLATSTTTSVLATGLTPATAYSLAVRAKDTRGNTGPLGASVAARTVDPATDTSPPTAPGALRSTAVTSSSITLAWTAAADNQRISAYDVYQGATLVQTVTGATTTATVAGLSPSTAYTFTVKARDPADNASPASNALTVSTGDLVGPGKYARVGYFTQWGIYGRQYFVKNLDTSGSAAKLDVVNYAFENIDPVNLTCLAGVTKGTTADPQDPDQGTGAGDADADYARPMSAAQSVDGVADDGWGPLRGNLGQLKKLKAKYPNLKVVVSLGGWTYSKYFSDAAATDASRKKLVASCLDIWIKGNLPLYNGAGGPGVGAGIFDGIDLDWEWPGSADGHAGNHWSAADKDNLTLLLAEFRKQLDALGGSHKLLTAFTPADPVKINQGWDLSKIFTYLDIANVQGYDFHGAGSDNSWEPNRAGHQANLYADTQDPYTFHFSVDAAVQAYLTAGVNPRKLTIGFPFYGRGWQGVTAGGANGEWQAATGAAPGQFAEEAGTRGYNNLLAGVPDLTVHHDTQSISTYGYTGAGGQWWSFDDPWSIGQKTAYLKSKGLLGSMIWEMSGDTPTGTLITALDNGLK
ncbi:glycosyl hydrolase family 18 protein [Kitasatospora sp. NBC_00240]|uniref:glycosyl hydrolase family 18 protein n=1 Tax=Kitasatospora sp. NBC_00240 TaxID=2903567 RepID=UPI00225B6F4A|nr:glycosyl hydrolase family 18 protein [Kitasatospora sp. NBC_00240]MCX5213977.1 glycosyl hydrolase family 18 protein [Kitasatospora sp. NBC_00240]